MFYARFGGIFHIPRAVPADPGVDSDFISDGAAEQLVEGYAKATGFEIPERNVDAGQRGHEHRPTTVETQPVRALPEMFDVAIDAGSR